MDMQKYLELFVSEANEHIQGAGSDVALLAAGITAPETLNSLFRHFHSIKGMAASMGFGEIATLSHAVEDLCDRLRKNGGRPPSSLTDLVMEALDSTSAMVAWASRGQERGEITIDTRPIIDRIRASMPPVAAAAPAPAASSMRTTAPQGGPAERRFACRVAIDPEAEFVGARAALVLKKLETVGRIAGTEPDRDALLRRDFKGEVFVDLFSQRPEADILAVVKGLLDLKRFELREAAPPAAGDTGGAAAAADGGEATSVRIPTATLDHFLDAIAEMISRRGALSASIRGRDLETAREALRKLSESVDSLRRQVMLVRLMPFDHITPRLTRTVRELCRRTGKRVAVTISGADVSLDRSVLEQIIDPFNHILRNAVDHGIELPAERELLGKPAEGGIRIDVARAGDHVVIAAEDDGRGMDKEAIKRAAVKGGFATEAELAAMDDQRIFLLTTIPGFSTVSRVTEVSGRGVGMDIVRTRIEALHGHMKIASRRGLGTRIEMTLPLTVAVIDAFLVECGAGLFAVPARPVATVEMVEASRIRRTLAGTYLASRAPDATVDGGAGGGSASDEPPLLPLVDLDEAFGAGGLATDATVQVLAYQANGARGALAVRRIRERREVVVKPLGPPLERLRKYSGAALLDDGSVALILDLANLSST